MPISPTQTDEAGLTLLELLVVLTVLALVSSLLAYRYGGAGGQRSFERGVAAVRQLLETAHAEAVLRGRLRRVSVREIEAAAPELRVAGDGGDGRPITFLPDGTASGGALLLFGEGRSTRLEIDWLTGRPTSDAP